MYRSKDGIVSRVKMEDYMYRSKMDGIVSRVKMKEYISE